MKRDRGYPLKHVEAGVPPKDWTGHFSPKRARRQLRLHYRHIGRVAETSAVMAAKRGAEETAKRYMEQAQAMYAKAKSLLGFGGHRVNKALRRAA